ncbi:hypothetical protein A6A29_19325 [Streptomyces sp. TSRI0281]|nr:hypothetical protein A6A29_19325 [Streptomyces sp. TSRI0281]
MLADAAAGTIREPAPPTAVPTGPPPAAHTLALNPAHPTPTNPTPTNPTPTNPTPTNPTGPTPTGPTPADRIPTTGPTPADRVPSAWSSAPASSAGSPAATGNSYDRQNLTPEDQERQRRLRRRIRTIAVTSSLVTTAVSAAVLIWVLVPPSGGTGDEGDRPSVAASTPSGDRSGNPTPKTSTGGGTPVADTPDTPAEPANLLTPKGVRGAIKALKPLMGGTRVTDFTVHEEHASAKAPLKSNSTLYDQFTYRDGEATNDDMGGTLPSGETSVDLLSVDWDVLPALLRTADKTLNVPDPEYRYVIVDPSSPFHDDQPVLRVYVSDKYGGAFLTAHLDGRVIEKNPRAKG